MQFLRSLGHFQSSVWRWKATTEIEITFYAIESANMVYVGMGEPQIIYFHIRGR